MSLFKKIFILVNLILCMLCINAFASSFTVSLNGLDYNVCLPNETVDLSQYPYKIVVHNSANQYYIYFSNKPFIVIRYETVINNISCYYYYLQTNSNSLNKRFSIFRNFFGSETELERETNYSLVDFESDLPCSYFSTDRKNIETNEIVQTSNTPTLFYSSHSLIAEDGYVLYESKTSFDESEIDWESAFDFYVGSLDLGNIEGKAYEYAGHNYSEKLYLFWALHSLDDTISVSATEELGFTYFLESNLEFVFTDSKGEKHSEIIPTTHVFNDSIFTFELPYLVRNDSLGKKEEYSPFLMALEFYLGPFTGDYENWEAWFYECVECYVDSYGFFDYEIILHSKVYKMYDYDISTKTEVYTYSDIPITYDMNSSSYVAGKDGPTIFYPDKDNKDVYYILGPNGEIVGNVDNTDGYDIDEDNNLVDKDGNVIGRPEFDETTGNWNFVNPDGDVITNIYNINDIPTPDEIIDNIEVIGDYDLSRIFTGLKYELEELLEGNSLFNKFANMFQQVINWLPFSIKSLFFILISFYLIFEFIHILRK